MERPVVIVVPIYKEGLDVFEKVSLAQLSRVLGAYPICFVMPEKLAWDLGENFDHAGAGQHWIERFPDSYFSSTESYSRLCLSEEFYGRFLAYEYMLIYQTDAFAFSDRLAEFIGMGFDYIGAAMKNKHWRDYHVGNGGLSLRNVQRTLAVVREKESIVEKCSLWEDFENYEDLFFGYCAYREDVDYTAAPIDIANRFSIDEDHCGGFRMMNEYGLPFGTHRWTEGAYIFWKPIIETYGYNLPRIEDVPFGDMLEGDRYERIFNFIPKWYLETDIDMKKRFLNYAGMNINHTYMVWGAGYHGKRCIRTLVEMGFRVIRIIDSAAQLGDAFLQIPIVHLEELNNREILATGKSKAEAIVIAVYGKEREITGQAKELHIEKFKYISWFSILDKMIAFLEKEIPPAEGVTIPFTIEIAGGVNGHRIRYPYR